MTLCSQEGAHWVSVSEIETSGYMGYICKMHDLAAVWSSLMSWPDVKLIAQTNKIWYILYTDPA